jgi:hypothetical protein
MARQTRCVRVHAEAAQASTPLLYARLNDASTAFERERNLMTRTFGLDRGGAITADMAGHFYVAWHAKGPGAAAGESGSPVHLTMETFSEERPAANQPTGACGCCGMAMHLDSRGNMRALYLSIRNGRCSSGCLSPRVRQSDAHFLRSETGHLEHQRVSNEQRGICRKRRQSGGSLGYGRPGLLRKSYGRECQTCKRSRIELIPEASPSLNRAGWRDVARLDRRARAGIEEGRRLGDCTIRRERSHPTKAQPPECQLGVSRRSPLRRTGS